MPQSGKVAPRLMLRFALLGTEARGAKPGRTQGHQYTELFEP